MVARGLDAHKFVHIPNGFDPEASQANAEPLPAEHRQVIEDCKRAGKRLVLYSGNHGLVNALDTVLDAARLLGDGVAIHWLLVGQGPEKQRLQRRARQARLKNLTFLSPVTRSQMPALTGAVDAGYVGLQRKDLFRYGVSPNKLFEYMAAGLPVIFAVETCDDPVAQAGAGFSIPAESPAVLAETVRELGAMAPGRLHAIGTRGRRHIEHTHSYAELARHYAELF
jgi:glycosyltransferase involved in cell wall biosynthesis